MLYPAELRARSSFDIRTMGGAASHLMRFLLWGLVLLVCFNAREPWATTFQSRADAIEGADELRLGDGRLIKIANIVVPDGEPRRLVETWLEKHVRGEIIEVTLLNLEPDRYARFPATIKLQSGADLGETLLERGLVLVEPMIGEGFEGLFAAETRAREAQHGFWADGQFSIMPVGLVDAEPLRFVVARGEIKAVGEGGYHAYLNFGDNWRRDFTVRFAKDDLEVLFGDMLLEDFVGEVIEVRGWLFDANGPMIQIEHPGQLKRLGE